MQLQVAAHETQIRSAALVARQSEVIAELYRLLVICENEQHGMIRPVRFSGEPLSNELAPGAIDAMNAFARYFLERRIFLAPDACDALMTLLKLYKGASLKFTLWGIDGERDDGLQHERFESQSEAWKLIDEQAPKAREALEAQFRGLLTVK